MPTPMTYDKMIRNRARLFNANKINNTFEPFIGKTYFCEWQKKILFIAYDEWSYRTEENPSPTTRTLPKRLRGEEKDISWLFRSCPYYKHIDKVLKSIKCGLTAEDVAFYNFLVHPIRWELYKKYGLINKARIIKESVKAFELVIDFCNPDLVIFCSMEDYHQINEALDSKLNRFLRERGIEYLESGNLNYDTNISPEIDIPTKNKRNEIRIHREVLEFDDIIGGKDEIDDEDTWDYDYKLLDLQQVTLKNENKYKNIPDELQKLASFIDSELKSTGSFIRHRMLQLLKELERNVQRNFLNLMDYLNDDILAFPSKPSYDSPIPGIFDDLHMLKAIATEYEKAIIEPTIPKRKLCCSFSSKTKREFLLEKQAKELAKKKQDILEDSNKKACGEDSNDNKIEKTTDRWIKMKSLNPIEPNRIEKRKKFDSLLSMQLSGAYQLSNEDYNFLIENSLQYTGLSLGELEEEVDSSLYPEESDKKIPEQTRNIIMNKMRSEPNISLKKLSKDFRIDEKDLRILYNEVNDNEFQTHFDQIYNKIMGMIRNDREISLEALSKANLIDEYYLSKLLKEWNVKNKNGRWSGPELDSQND